VLHLLLNPIAGRGRALSLLAGVEAALNARREPWVLLRSEYPGHARTLALQVPEGGTLLLMGGDGSVHEVLPACVAGNLRLAILPCGSGDDFAFALGLPRHDPLAALALLGSIGERRVDLGEVNGELFANAFGSGFDAEVARRVLAAPPLFKGLARYLYGIAVGLRDFRLGPLQLDLEHPDGSHSQHRGPSLLVSAQNGPRGGGSFLFAPGARVDDGVLDVVVAGAFGRIGTLAILNKVAKGAHEGHPQVRRYAATSLSLRWATPTPAHAEGELLATAREYRVRVLPGALRVAAPASNR
jgi:diacylglycerol kinase family enzyme